MDHDSTDSPKPSARARRGAAPDSRNRICRRRIRRKIAESAAADIDPATSGADEDDEARLPELPEEAGEAVPEGPLAIGHAAIEHAVRLAPTSPGVYRMLNAATTCSMSARPRTSASGCRPMPG